jgi:Sigma-70, region 4
MVNLVADRQSIGDALARLSAEHRAVICRSYYEARTTAQIADDLRRSHREIETALRHASATARSAGNGVTDNAVAFTPPAALDTAPPGRSRRRPDQPSPERPADRRIWERIWEQNWVKPSSL